MKEFRSKGINKRRLYASWVFIILAIIAFVAVRAAWRAAVKAQNTRESLNLIEGEFDDLRKQEASLLAEIERLQNDDGREGEIRKRFNVVKEGEEVVVIVPDKESDDSSQRIMKEKSFWGKVLGFFGGD